MKPAGASGRLREWPRRYPPLTAVIIALALAVFALPSALNLPQANPSQTLEYAPVPGEQGNTSSGGNFAGLGLGSGGGVGPAGAALPPAPADQAAPPQPDQLNTGGRPSSKNCVGNPPRQTEDLLSPPCVAFYNGDNGGATYPGVTGSTISILFYVTGASYQDVGSQGVIAHPIGKCFEASDPPAVGEDYYINAGRIWQTYFNARYQTYKREARVHVCFASTPDGTSQSFETTDTRRRDAADEYGRYKPFATIVEDYAGGNSEAYIATMAAKGVLNFGSIAERREATLQAYPNLIWSYAPSVEAHARQFSTYVCTKVVPYKTSFGDPAKLNQDRRLGLLHTKTPALPEQRYFADLVKKQIAACGGNIVDDQGVPSAGSNNFGAANPPDQGYAQSTVASFVKNNVTTVIWEETLENGITPAAHSARYYPEWILAGDGALEDIVAAKYQDSSEWANAWAVSEVTLQSGVHSLPCVQAAKEADPQLPDSDRAIPCRVYDYFRQLFTGIQVAGPKLTASNVAAGFHAIPGHPSSSPDVPSCYYPAGDYTCVKDEIAMWFDATATSRYSAQPGCWRATEGGRRYPAGTWPGQDVATQRNRQADPCNSYASGRFSDPSPGPDSPTAQ